jgi:DNA-binding SARP family transcriptional activator/tetratricopeptide (TPR) repeat protein
VDLVSSGHQGDQSGDLVGPDVAGGDLAESFETGRGQRISHIDTPDSSNSPAFSLLAHPPTTSASRVRSLGAAANEVVILGDVGAGVAKLTPSVKLDEAESGPPSISARLLGSFAVRVAGQEVQGWPRPPSRRLVQMLMVAEGHKVTRAEVAGAVFPDAHPEQCRRAVSKALSQARRVLGAGAIVAEGRFLRLAGEVHTDLDDVRAGLRAGLRMEPGPARRGLLERELGRMAPLLPGESDADWVAFPRRQLGELVRAARLALAEEIESASGSAEGWEAAFGADPGDEEVAVGLIGALRRMGADARAVHVYRACRAELGRSGAASPSAQLEAAVRGLFPVAPVPASAAAGLVGRDDETKTVLGWLRGAEDHVGGAVLVSGPAGIGKTALLEAVFAALRQQGWRVGMAAAGEGDELVPYSALRAALTDVLRSASPGVVVPASVRALLRAGGRRSEVRLALPLLAGDLDGLLDRLAVAAPVLVVVDDVHRGDAATHELVARLVAARPARSWSLLLSARSDEPGRPVPVFPPEMSVLQLGGLDAPSAQVLARRHLESARVTPQRREELATLAVRWSRGNPLFLVELIRHGAAGATLSRQHVDSVPPRVVELFEQRLAGCSAAARSTLPLVALAEPHADVALVAELEQTLGLDRCSAAGVIDELVAAAVVVWARGGLRLSHPLWRQAALSRLNPLRLASLHSQIADALDRLTGRELVSAGHRIAAFRSTRLADYAQAAARSGLAAGHVARNLVADAAALELLAAALTAFETVPASRRRTLRRAAFAGWMDIGHIRSDRLELDAAAEAFEQALGLADGANDFAAAYSALGGVCYKRGDFEQAEAIYTRGLRLVAGGSVWAQARLGADIAWARHRRGDVDGALSAMTAAADQFSSTKDKQGMARCFDLLAVLLEAAGRLDEAFVASDKALVIADRCEDVRLAPSLAIHRSGLLLTAGSPAQAEREARRALDAARRVDDRYLEAVAQWKLADSLDATGDLRSALACRRSEQTVLVELANLAHLSRCLAHQASLLDRLGRRRDALDHAAQARRVAADTGDADLCAVVEEQLAALGSAAMS